MLFRVIFILLILLKFPLLHAQQTLYPENLEYFPPLILKKEECKPQQKAPTPTHQVSEKHLQLDTWIKQWKNHFNQPQNPILKPIEIKQHQQSLIQRSKIAEPLTQIDITQALSPEDLNTLLSGRLSYLKDKVTQGKYVGDQRQSLSAQEIAQFEISMLQRKSPEYRLILQNTQNLCAPYPKAMYQTEGDMEIDRNACTVLKKGELVEVLSIWGDQLLLVRNRLALGWIPKNTALSDQISLELAQKYEQAESRFFKKEVYLHINDEQKLEMNHQSMGKADELIKIKHRIKVDIKQKQIYIPHQTGVKIYELQEQFHQFFFEHQFTPQNFLTRLFSYLNDRYGLGDGNGGIDCSRMIVDIFDTFGLALPRYSGHQALAGIHTIDLKSITDSRQRYAILEKAIKNHIILLGLPGHIMVYLGKDEHQQHYAFHALAEYIMPCEDGNESILKVNQATVTDLERGRGGSKGALIDRITHVVFIGTKVDDALLDLVQARPALPLNMPSVQQCKKTRNQEQKLFFFPKSPSAKEGFSIVMTSPFAIARGVLGILGNHQGEKIELKAEKIMGGAPYIYEWKIKPLQLQPQNYTIAFGEGDQLLTCTQLALDQQSKPIENKSPSVWEPEKEWDAHDEALYAAFIEKLFDYEQLDQSWKNLQDLILVKDKNLLYQYLGQNEDSKLRLEPDCADLPYTLRAYFAWKMRLPFAVRNCSRGSAKSAPQCDQSFTDSSLLREGKNKGDEFQWFARAYVSKMAHSASVRTLPQDDFSDLYPIALTKEALRPGIVYGDPYGHILLISSWKRQALGGAGILIASDGQPDGTIARKRFWEGSFLFDPATNVVGAGFKAFRPLIKEKGQWRSVSNQELLNPAKFHALTWSEQQYQGQKEDFYDRINALISPLFTDPLVYLRSLISSLHESARGRVLSVQNGVDFIQKNPKTTISMPTGYSIFETSGPWEDFATPSRDMRLLISIDTAFSAKSVIQRNQNRFGIKSYEILQKILNQVDRDLPRLLSEFSIEYLKSDGRPQKLNLQEIVDRKKNFEVTYNPNDCPELRWGAPMASEEMKTCQRRAPKNQQQLLEKYRPWFRERKRPPRGSR